MSTNMGNLEKLGILVIVILVVVVGVVAITPKSTVDERLVAEPPAPADQSAPAPEMLEPAVGAAPGQSTPPQDPWPKLGADGKPLPAGTVAADPSSKVNPLGGPPAPIDAPAAATFRTVKIQKGDTPAMIAKRELGSAARYRDILDANPGLDARKLTVGKEIKIPLASTPAGGGSSPVAMNSPGSDAGVPVAPIETPAPSADRTYVVKSGDTLSSIASRELGSTKKWTELARSNESVLHGSTVLKVGMKLQLPSGDGSASLPSRSAAPSTGSAAGAGERDYVVKSGDSLWAIAKSEMGSEVCLKDLKAANQDVLKGSDSLRVGMKLRIPAGSHGEK